MADKEKKINAATVAYGMGVLVLIAVLIYFFSPAPSLEDASPAPSEGRDVEDSDVHRVTGSDESEDTVKVRRAEKDISDEEEEEQSSQPQQDSEEDTSSLTETQEQEVMEVYDCGVESSFIFQECWWTGTRIAEVTLLNNGRSILAGAYIYVEGDSGEIRKQVQKKAISEGSKAVFSIDIPYYENRVGNIARIKLAPLEEENNMLKACANQIQTFDPDIDCT